MSQSAKPRKRLGDQLLDAGLISAEQLDLALLEQKRSGNLLGNVLQDLGFVTDQEVSALLAQAADTRTVELDKLDIEIETLQAIPYEIAKDLSLIPVQSKNDSLTVAMADPFDVEAIDQVERLTRMMVKVVAASKKAIADRLEKEHEKSDSIEKIIQELLKLNGAENLSEDEAPIIRLVNTILQDAQRRAASDIHIEPDEKSLRIRFRIDGVLQPYVIAPKDLQNTILARIKVMSGLDVSETRLPQDGRLSIEIGHKRCNLRISSLPTCYGESIVARILDSESVNLSIGSLGMRPEDAERFAKATSAPHGMILVTGPTGSGKTTTLYTALKEVNKLERSVFTLEDPIEYRLEYTRQTQVNEKIGLTFNSGLRTLLRQDPDVIFVGETRDRETAQLLVRAALTGHLVLSSLHTNDAVSAIPRLFDLGVDPSMVASTLQLVIGQRLARKLCPSCKKKAENIAYYQEILGSDYPTDSHPFYQPVGCPDCFNKGYKGRLAVFETLYIDDDIRPLIPSADIAGITKLMQKKNMNTLFKDGLRRAIEGETTVEEVLRIATHS